MRTTALPKRQLPPPQDTTTGSAPEVVTRMNPKRFHAASCVGMSEAEAASHCAPPRMMPSSWFTQPDHIASRQIPRRRSSHGARLTLSKPHPAADMVDGPRRSSHDPQMLLQKSSEFTSATLNGPTHGSRPGDAQHRCTAVESFARSQPEGARVKKATASKRQGPNVFALQAVPAHRSADRNLPTDMACDLSPTQAELTVPIPRPKLASHDRADWTQCSQAGDDSKNPLRLLHRIRRSETPMVKKQRHNSEGALPTNLISDAVKLIKQEETWKRRKSVMGFFRRF